MDELAPGLWHWTAFRNTIRRTVHSAYDERSRTLIDPMLPDEGLAWFADHNPPERIVLAGETGALAVADGLLRDDDGELGFMPDFLLGDDPESVKRGLADSYLRIAETLDFDVLLLAHGEPLVGGAREALRSFAASQVREAA
ncbi:MAG TPA: hypothetical protein VKB03_06100 [Conexibacter sp.]|nr:hypothetical protein [Conexibacter sp.]